MPGEISIFALAFAAQVAALVAVVRRVKVSRAQLDVAMASGLGSTSVNPESPGNILQQPGSGVAVAFDWSEAVAECRNLAPFDRIAAVAAGYSDWFQSLLSYRFLERMTVVAPLLGLLVTCWGLFGGRVNLSDIQGSMTPLVFGVGGGAALALVNQFLLFAVQSQAASVQAACRTYLRQSFAAESHWAGPSAGLGGITPQAIETLRVATERNEELVRMLQHLNGRFVDQSDHQRTVATGLLGAMEALPLHMSQLAKAIDGAQSAFAHGSTSFEAVASTLQREVNGFSQTISAQLAPLVSAQALHMEDWGKITTSSREAMGRLGETVGLLQSVAVQHEEVAQAYRESVDGVIIPSHKQIREAASKIGSTVQSLSAPLQGLVDSIQDYGARMDSGSNAFNLLQQGANRFADGIENTFIPAVERQLNMSDDLRKSAAEVLAAAEGMRSGVGGLDVSAKYQAATTDRMLDVIEQKVIPTYQLLERTALSLDNAVQAFVENASDLSQAALHQSTSVDSLRSEVNTVVRSFAEAGDRLAKREDAASEPLTAVTSLIAHTSDLTKQIEPVVRVLQSGVDGLRTALSDNARAKNDLIEAIRANESATGTLTEAARSVKEAALNAATLRNDAAELVMPYLRQLHDELDRVLRAHTVTITASEVASTVAEAIEPLKGSIDALAANVANISAAPTKKGGWFR